MSSNNAEDEALNMERDASSIFRPWSKVMNISSTGEQSNTAINKEISQQYAEFHAKVRAKKSGKKYVPPLPPYYWSPPVTAHANGRQLSIVEMVPSEIMKMVFQSALSELHDLVEIVLNPKYKRSQIGTFSVAPLPDSVVNLMGTCKFFHGVVTSMFKPVTFNNRDTHGYVCWESERIYVNSDECLRELGALGHDTTIGKLKFTQQCRKLAIPEHSLNFFMENMYIPYTHFDGLKELHLIENETKHNLRCRILNIHETEDTNFHPTIQKYVPVQHENFGQAPVWNVEREKTPRTTKLTIMGRRYRERTRQKWEDEQEWKHKVPHIYPRPMSK